MKYCTDCRYSDKDRLANLRCTHPQFVNPVDGTPAEPLCMDARLPGAACGVEGKLWQARGPAEPPPPLAA